MITNTHSLKEKTIFFIITKINADNNRVVIYMKRLGLCHFFFVVVKKREKQKKKKKGPLFQGKKCYFFLDSTPPYLFFGYTQVLDDCFSF